MNHPLTHTSIRREGEDPRFPYFAVHANESAGRTRAPHLALGVFPFNPAIEGEEEDAHARAALLERALHLYAAGAPIADELDIDFHPPEYSSVIQLSPTHPFRQQFRDALGGYLAAGKRYAGENWTATEDLQNVSWLLRYGLSRQLSEAAKDRLVDILSSLPGAVDPHDYSRAFTIVTSPLP